MQHSVLPRLFAFSLLACRGHERYAGAVASDAQPLALRSPAFA